jgi:hypothetical protein
VKSPEAFGIYLETFRVYRKTFTVHLEANVLYFTQPNRAGLFVHSHAGNITVTAVDFVEPGGTLMIRPYIFPSRHMIPSPAICSSPHSSPMYRLKTGSSLMIALRKALRK